MTLEKLREQHKTQFELVAAIVKQHQSELRILRMLEQQINEMEDAERMKEKKCP